ncbi:N-acetyltransferase [Rhizobium sp. S95]|uniref:N-acetyltransferase n=1 Tax=Ciceribacter sichuanensis TaxID=2949647 RepID=A0AAJ1F9Y9_9HYPH|nr:MULTISPECIES: N-acetyltransferase [unclassified Ciceribacter]MCM2399500.1 N-acetyltransferase [Ciceribacter sp. S95]MCO5959708.1 N-acetyltransferase [Ciceribacter sp. S101]
MIIRDEAAGDETAIGAVTAAAFADMPYSNQTEPRIIERLRQAGAMTISLVAEDGGDILGHIAFSPVTLAGGETGWYGLGPVSVRPDLQKRGIGSTLVNEGLKRLKMRDAQGCVLVGYPDYYKRFGFASCPTLKVEGVSPEYLLALPLRGPVPSGIVAFHPGFYGDAT